jgi:hypothetical protein
LLGLSAHGTFVERGHEHGSVSDEVLAAPPGVAPAVSTSTLGKNGPVDRWRALAVPLTSGFL